MQDNNKYRWLWKVGTAISFVLFYSGISQFYLFFRKVVFKRYRTVVLTYHRVRDDGRHTDISVSVKQFERQLKYLSNAFIIAPLGQAVRWIQNGHHFTNDVVSVTFDDGYEDNYTHALPLLWRYKTPATIFLVSDLIDRSDQMLSTEQIKAMQAFQIDFGSHTASHPVLSEQPVHEINMEIQHSKKELENALDTPISMFAYPKGKRRHYNAAAISALKKAGYSAAFTTENGPLKATDPIYELKRNGIRDCPLFVFKVRLSGIFESRPAMLLRKMFNVT